MHHTAFIPSHCLPKQSPLRRYHPPKCMTHRVAIQTSTAPRHNIRVTMLTDFSSNPLLAISDRVVDPLSAIMLFVAAVLGALFSYFSGHRSASSKKSTGEEEKVRDSLIRGEQGMQLTAAGSVGGSTPGENALWLNMRNSTNSLTCDVLQPVLDTMEFPEFVCSVKIVRLSLGESPALVRKIQRLPSRSLNEIQYKFGARLVGDKEGSIDLEVKIKFPGMPGEIAVPVTVSALDIDAKVWIGLTVVPYPPWIRFAQWSFLKMPVVKLRVMIAKYFPVTAVPLLSNVLNKVLTKDLPKEFLFPKTQFVDMMGECATDIDLEYTILEARGVKTGLGEFTDGMLQEQFPALVGIFRSMDLNCDGILDAREVSEGLIQWGYASPADRNSIRNLLDVNSDGYVDLREFITVWDDLKSLFVPRQFRGVLTGVLLKAEGLRTPTLGFTDPYVEMRIEAQHTTSKKNKATSKTGKGKGFAVWNEGWELFVRQPKTAILTVLVREGSYFTYYKDYIPPATLPTTHSGTGIALSPVQQANRLDKIIGIGTLPLADIGQTAKSLWIDLTKGGGRVRMDLQFSEFVDPQVP